MAAPRLPHYRRQTPRATIPIHHQPICRYTTGKEEDVAEALVRANGGEAWKQ
jgi:hypothetical protein